MYYTLHLTGRCNMRCDYCYVAPSSASMTAQTARAAVDLAVSRGDQRLGLLFFGGEPLLCRELIYDTVAYARGKFPAFRLKMTTNGLLLDREFISFAKEVNLNITLSLDGTQKSHDAHRVASDRSHTHSRVVEAAKELLKAFPKSSVIATVNPDTGGDYDQSIKFLYELGFRNIISTPNFAAGWDEDSLGKLGKSYQKLADFYVERTMAGDRLYFSPFDSKIGSHVRRENACRERCQLGLNQVSVSPEGVIYPCVQFVGDEKYRMGDVFGGFDEERRRELYLQNEDDNPDCGDCAIKERCNCHCACLNRQTTGRIDGVSPVVCAHEQLLLPIADRAAAILYREKSPEFMRKYYS